MKKTNIVPEKKYFLVLFFFLFLIHFDSVVAIDPDITEQVEGYVEHFSFSDNSRYLAILLWDNTLQIFRMKKKNIELKKEIYRVKDYTFSKNSNYVAVIFWTGNLEVVDLRSFKTLFSLASVKKFEFSPDSKNLCVIFKQIDVKTKRESSNKHLVEVFGIANQYS